jgi:hypothetical protein
MTHWLKRTCPSCGSNDIDAKSSVKAAHIADDMSFEEVAEFWRGFRKDSCFFTFSRCQKCGLLYCQNYFTEEQLQSLYSNMGDNSAGVADTVLEKTQRGYYSYLSDYGFDTQGSYLELGPDTGLLTKNFAQAGVLAISLIEPNHEVRQELLDSTIPCEKVEILSDLNQLDPDSKFSTISGIHVFDHLVNLQPEFERIASLSQPNAKILIVVHDESSILRRILRKKWPPFCLQHPQLFNPKTISNSLRLAGFENIEVQKSTNWFPIRHVGMMVSSLFGMHNGWVRVLPSKEVPLRLGNMVVAASKEQQ